MAEEETTLAGGFSNVVTRRGPTVRRNAGPWTPSVHALLRHLRAEGFGLAPEPLGIDDRGREILGYLEGDVAWWPWPAALRQDHGLRQVARAVRDLHQAVATFEEPADAVWHSGPRERADHVLRHGDLAPWNTLWVGDRLTGLIDWDTVEPAPPDWDAAQGAWYFVPLRPMSGYRAEGPSFTLGEQAHRLAVWCEEVGVEVERLIDVLTEVQRADQERIRTRGTAGQEPYASFLARGIPDEVERERRWLSRHRQDLIDRRVDIGRRSGV